MTAVRCVLCERGIGNREQHYKVDTVDRFWALL